MNNRKILLIGKEGQLGYDLEKALAPLGELYLTDRKQLDLSEPLVIKEVLRSIKPDIIVNAAAYTNVEQAEEEISQAFAINKLAPTILAEEAKQLGSILIHFSTDYVFDGMKETPYTEEDLPNPLNVYGKSKYLGELGIQNSECSHFIFRTSWVYSRRRKNFLNSIIKLKAEQKTLKIVSDQIGIPNWSGFIANVVAEVVAKPNKLQFGMYHLTSSGQASWFDFAQLIIQLLEKNTLESKTDILTILSSEYPSRCLRPSYSVLSNHKLEKALNIKIPNWNKYLELCLNGFNGEILEERFL